MRRSACPVPCRKGLVHAVLGGFLLAASSGFALAAEPLFSHENPRFRSGAELMADCASEAPAAQGRCNGYIMAIADVLGGAGAQVDGVQVCLRGDEGLAELVAEVRAHLQANPARQAIKGDGAVAYALSLYRPCPPS
ncbi:Rap1a/Tai family immunity protein [Pelagibius sp.]|uniref:Rap1a/Tai family immunity protein n=1 Tax=Pelagibius sp. TaxID=1931238 RepID=UPI003BB0D8BD